MSVKISGWHRSNRQATAEFKRNRVIVRNRDKGCCFRCEVLYRRIVLGKDVDHYIPLAYGGTDEASGLWYLCRDCHDRKTRWETKDRIGFPPQIDVDTGYRIREPDWQTLIRERQAQWDASASI